jgi:hypothetical protein
MKSEEQLELFVTPVDNRFYNLRKYIITNGILTKNNEITIKEILEISAMFGIIEGRVLEVIKEEKKKFLKGKHD